MKEEDTPEEVVNQLMQSLGASAGATPEALLDRFLENNGKGFTARDLLPIAILLRNVGRLPLRHSFFQIAMLANHIGEGRVQKVYSERYYDRLRLIDEAHGLGENEEWEEGEAPAEHTEMFAEFKREEDRIRADVLREYGELAMAALFLDDRVEFDRLYEIGRCELFGSLPKRPQEEKD